MSKRISNGKSIVYVYNAHSSITSQLIDVIHKKISPQTYQCNLCKLTYNLVSMKQDWKKFIDQLPYDSIFLHKDEYSQRYPEYKNVSLPCIFVEQKNELVLLVSAIELNKVQDLEELKEILTSKLKQM